MSGSRGVCAAHGARALCVSAHGCRRTKGIYGEVSLYCAGFQKWDLHVGTAARAARRARSALPARVARGLRCGLSVIRNADFLVFLRATRAGPPPFLRATRAGLHAFFARYARRWQVHTTSGRRPAAPQRCAASTPPASTPPARLLSPGCRIAVEIVGWTTVNYRNPQSQITPQSTNLLHCFRLSFALLDVPSMVDERKARMFRTPYKAARETQKSHFLRSSTLSGLHVGF